MARHRTDRAVDARGAGRAHLRAPRGCARTWWPASCWPPSWSPRAWPTRSWPGLPPVTGLYTTIACLVGYAIFGPSRILVLGPDSSVSPLIFAAIVPLLVDRRPGHRHRPGRHAGRVRGPHRDRHGPRQARLRRRPALQGGAGRLHERPGRHHHRRPAAQAVRVLDRRRHVHRRGAGLLRRPRPDQRHHARRRVGVPGGPVPAPAAHPPRAVGAGGGRRGHHRVGGVRARRAERETVGSLPQGVPTPVLPLDDLERRGTAAHRRRRHHPGLAHRHHRHLDELRRPARRRGRPRPGDDRHGRRQHRRGVLPGLRGVDERVAHGGGRAVRRQEPGHRPGRRRPRRPDAALLPLAAGRPPADRRSPRS